MADFAYMQVNQDASHADCSGVPLTASIAEPFTEFIRWKQSAIINWQQVGKCILIAHL